MIIILFVFFMVGTLVYYKSKEKQKFENMRVGEIHADNVIYNISSAYITSQLYLCSMLILCLTDVMLLILFCIVDFTLNISWNYKQKFKKIIHLYIAEHEEYEIKRYMRKLRTNVYIAFVMFAIISLLIGQFVLSISIIKILFFVSFYWVLLGTSFIPMEAMAIYCKRCQLDWKSKQ